MTKDEALAFDLALEAIAGSGDFLFNWHDCEPNNEHEMSRYQEVLAMNEKAFIAIKQARALDKKAENARELGLDYEPVTTLFGSLPVWDNLPSNKDVEDAMRVKRLNQLATPPAQRQWVEVEQIKWEGDKLIAKLKENT